MTDDISRLKEEEKSNNIEIDKTDLNETGTVSTDSGRRTAVSQNKNWVGGVILIAIGVIFLVTNLGGFQLNNWWALFILIPAFSNFASAWENYSKNRRLTKSGRGSIVGGLILSLIAFTFIFEWSWAIIWPVFLIIGGVGALIGGWFE
ncbi:MAG: hypothetical protein KBE23_20135 [Chloroflexi bacterium]|nr:hypothetical protein [Chloroflexota bacterium]MBP7045073.1 hypothetical protein [Chloroflexota bacterium]